MTFARLAGVAVALAAIAAPADAQVLLPTQSVGGLTQSQMADKWWQTFLPIAPAANPIADTTGANAAAGDLGNVFLLAGSLGDPVTRAATIPANRTLFFPLMNYVGWDQITAYGPTLAGLQRDLRETAGINPNGTAPNTALFATLDGAALQLAPGTTDLRDYRQFSGATFNQFVPSPNIFGLTDPDYPGTFPSVSDGWWLALAPLTPGNHVLHFGGTTTGYGEYDGYDTAQDVTYNLTVQPVPEPASLVLAGAAAAALAWRRGRRSCG